MSQVDPKALEVVEKAAAFLDSRDDFPKDWRDRINVETLNISDACNCICGQVKGDGAWGLFADAFDSGVGCYDPFSANWADDPSQPVILKAWKHYLRNCANVQISAESGLQETENVSEVSDRADVATGDYVCEGSRRHRKPQQVEKGLVVR